MAEEEEEEEEEPQPPINHVGMTLTCNSCGDDCKVACKDGTCKLFPRDRNP